MSLTVRRTVRGLTAGIDGYRWDVGEERSKGPVPVTYLIGSPA